MSREKISIALLFIFIFLLIVNVLISSYKLKKDFEYQEQAKIERSEGKKERSEIIKQLKIQNQLLKK